MDSKHHDDSPAGKPPQSNQGVNAPVADDLYRDLVEHSQDLLCTHDLEGRLISVNPAPARILGYSVEELLKIPLPDLLAPEARNQFPDYLARIQKDGVAEGLLVLLTRAGERRVWKYRNTLRREGLPFPIVRGMAHDVTDHLHVERELRRSEERYRRLVANLPDVTWTSTEDDRTTFISSNVHATLGYTAGEVCQRGHALWVERIHPEDSARVTEAYQALFAQNRPFDVEYRFQRKDGQWIWVHDRAFNTFTESGQRCADGIFSDITTRKLVENDLRSAEENFRTAFRAVPEGMSITTFSEGRYLEVNDAFCRMMEYDRSEMIGKTSVELRIWANPKDRAHFVERLRAGEPLLEEKTTFQTKSGRLLKIKISADTIRLQGQLRILAIMRDTTEHELLERQLQQAQKMEAVGHLAGGVAHDFNNLLGVVLGYSEILQGQSDLPDSARPRLQRIQEAAQRAAGLTRQLLAFSRQQILQPVVLSLNATITSLDKMLRRLIGEDVEIIVLLDPELGHVMADPGQIEQVLLNLAVNSRDAMPKGGKLTIQTRNESQLPDDVAAQRLMPPRDYVLLTVSDTGLGMNQEVQAHIFEPFFTTKGLGRGTGLGLSTVYGIVKQSNGFVWVESEIGTGTTFKIYLPRIQGAAFHGQDEAAVPLPRGSETILLVEDAAPLMELICESLEACGYQVLCSDNPVEALRTAQTYPGQISMLITDIVMPEMSGRTLAEKLTATHPGMTVLYISGYTDDTLLRHGVDQPGRSFLQKPFTRRVLASKVRELLDLPRQ